MGEFIKKYWFFFVLPVFLHFASVADQRKDSLAWQMGAAIGMGLFISTLCFYCYSMSFPFLGSFPEKPETLKRLRFLGRISVALPLLVTPLIIHHEFQQFHHQKTDWLGDVALYSILFSTMVSLFPWGFLLIKGVLEMKKNTKK